MDWGEVEKQFWDLTNQSDPFFMTVMNTMHWSQESKDLPAINSQCKSTNFQAGGWTEVQIVIIYSNINRIFLYEYIVDFIKQGCQSKK